VQSNSASPLLRELELTKERLKELQKTNHNLNEQLRYYKIKVSTKESADRSETIRHYRNQYKDIGHLLYMWITADQWKLDDHQRMVRASRILERVIGGRDGMGTLVKDINRQFNNVLVHLKDDFPKIGPADFKLFCYLAVGFDNDLIAELLGLPGKQALYTRKNRLKKKIEGKQSPYKKTYQALLK